MNPRKITFQISPKSYRGSRFGYGHRTHISRIHQKLNLKKNNSSKTIKKYKKNGRKFEETKIYNISKYTIVEFTSHSNYTNIIFTTSQLLFS